EQLIEILVTVGCPGGKADPALVRGLESKIASRRAGAVLALCKGRALAQAEAIRRLLKDSDLTVQLRAAQGLAMMGVKDSIPVLIGLLRDLPFDMVWEVEEYLGKVAGEKAPTEV